MRFCEMGLIVEHLCGGQCKDPGRLPHAFYPMDIPQAATFTQLWPGVHAGKQAGF